MPHQDLPKLTEVKRLLKIRNDIDKGLIHTGQNFELVLFSYNEIQKHFNRQPMRPSGCRSGCMQVINKILRNWFIEFDKQGGILPEEKEEVHNFQQAVKIVRPNGQMIPVDERRAELEAKSWAELKQILGEDKAKEIGNGKMAKKAQIIDELLKM